MARARQLAIVALEDDGDAELAAVLLEETGFDVRRCADAAAVTAAVEAETGRTALVVTDAALMDASAAAAFRIRFTEVEVVRVPSRPSPTAPSSWRPLDLLIRAEATRRTII